MEEIIKFTDLGLSEETLKVLKKKGFEEPTPIQRLAIPVILGSDLDIVGQAQTGTGKTAAFGLPMIEAIEEKRGAVQAIVLAPTRELAIQVAEEINSFKGKKKLTVIPVYGGQGMDIQLRSLRKGVDIVVGTPGRVMDHLKRRTLRLDDIKFLVLDEADEMLNMGFVEDVETIMDQTGPLKRTLLFSATMPPAILKIAKRYMGEYEVVKAPKRQLSGKGTDQIYFEVSSSDRFEALCRIIDFEEGFYGIVFCRTKMDVDAVAKHLIERGYGADGMHGDMSQQQREKILRDFKRRKTTIVVATDVAARGIDVSDLTHVINYALPQDPESYVHRIGRTGRAGKEGIAITFITPSEYRKLQFIKRSTKTDIRRGKLPNVKDIVKAKRSKIKKDLKDVIKGIPEEDYMDMAGDLLSVAHPEDIIAALLQYVYQDELLESSYTEISDNRPDGKGKTRLYVSNGAKDGLTKSQLTGLIRDKTKVRAEQIRDLQILDKFSFVTLPFDAAETLIAHFKKGVRGPGLSMKKANKSSRDKDGDDRNSRGGRGPKRKGKAGVKKAAGSGKGGKAKAAAKGTKKGSKKVSKKAKRGGT